MGACQVDQIRSWSVRSGRLEKKKKIRWAWPGRMRSGRLPRSWLDLSLATSYWSMHIPICRSWRSRSIQEAGTGILWSRIKIVQLALQAGYFLGDGRKADRHHLADVDVTSGH